jgi:thiol:disulfide interchange protein DsbD
MKQWLSGLLLVLTLSAPGFAEEEFLEPEDAFRLSARLASDQLLEVHYQIAEGYYMYRDRFRFEVEPESVVLGAARFPDGEWHEDAFFGRSEIYRNEVNIQIPILSGIGEARAIRLVAVSQGCADGGICYLPTRQTMDFESLGIGGGSR